MPGTDTAYGATSNSVRTQGISAIRLRACYARLAWRVLLRAMRGTDVAYVATRLLCDVRS
eukprot:3941927-Rhodomonas_salina.4